MTRGPLVALLLLALAACGTSVLDLEIGECVTGDTAAGLLTQVPVVDCAEPHRGEVFALPTLPDGGFPGDEAIAAQARRLCDEAFEPYVGLGYRDSQIFYSTLAPSARTWAGGDREIVCLLVDEFGADLRGSLRGSAR